MTEEYGSWKTLGLYSDGYIPRKKGERPANQRQKELEGFKEEKMSTTGVLTVGSGGIGWPYAQNMVRAGVGMYIAVDHDTVESVNLNRAFSQEDLGLPKTIALIRYLHKICVTPTFLRAIPYSIEQACEEVPDLFKGVTIIANGVDNDDARVYTNRIAIKKKLPAIFMAVSEDARHCEVMVARPDIGEACWECAYPKASNPDPNPKDNSCPPTATIGYIHAMVAAYGAYATTAIIMGWSLPWNLAVPWTVRDSRMMTVRRNPECPACGGRA